MTANSGDTTLNSGETIIKYCVPGITGDGTRSSNTWDADINLLNTKDARGYTTAYTYDANGNMITSTDPLGGQTLFTYEPTYNKLTSVTDALGRKTTYAYNELGGLTKLTDAAGNITQYGYDTFGNLINITNANGNTTTYAYDNYGNLISITDSLGNKTTLTYDLAGRKTSSTDPLGNTTQYFYASASGSSCSTCGINASAPSDKISKIIYPDNTFEEFEYDPAGNLTKKTDANANSTLYDYDASNRLIKVIDSLGNITKYAYDVMGNLISITDAESHTTTNTYDALNRLIKITDPLGYITQYAYDANGNLIKKTDPNNQVTEYEYDALNQLAKVYYGGKTVPLKTVVFGYDKVGNILNWNDSSLWQGAVATYTYDALSRVISVSAAYPFGAKAISYAYDKVGNKASLVYPDNAESVNYAYDKLNRLLQITDDRGQKTDYAHDNAGRLIKKTLPNAVYAEYVYDNTHKLLSLSNKKSDASIISSFAYTYDNVGNRTTMTTAEGTHNYAYDTTYRLTLANHPAQPDETFTFDKVGNRKTSKEHLNWAYDGNNRLTSYNGFTFTYDKNGNTLTKSDTTNTTTYAYDYENRLTRVIARSGSDEAIYAYDPFGKRIAKTVNGVTKYYLYDNEDIATEYDSAGNRIASYIHGQGIDDPIAMHRGSNTYYYTFDGLGSVSELTDSSQNVVESYKYDVFGNLSIYDSSLVLLLSSLVGNFYTYTSREYDSESGLYYYRARYYDANIGRFLGFDPLLEINLQFDTNQSYSIISWEVPKILKLPATLHGYTYTHNNPVNFTDPYGFKIDSQCYGECMQSEMKKILKRKAIAYGICVGACALMCIPVIPETGGAGYSLCIRMCISAQCSQLLSPTYWASDLAASAVNCEQKCWVRKGCK